MKDRLKCKICGKWYKHLGSHIWHAHKILAKEYKEEFGLPYKMGLISREIYEKKSKHFEENRERYVKNLLDSGKKYRFKKGCSGYRRISEYEKKKSIARIKKVNKKVEGKMKPCPVCRMKYYHLESHLYNKHKLLKV